MYRKYHILKNSWKNKIYIAILKFKQRCAEIKSDPYKGLYDVRSETPTKNNASLKCQADNQNLSDYKFQPKKYQFQNSLQYPANRSPPYCLAV